jgi:hypothetical protein
MLATLLIPEHSTVTNLICTGGGQHQDWTAHYRLYSKDRVNETVLFDRALETLLEHLPPGAPVVIGVDDTIVRKSGAHIHGSGWKRDPLGPPFQTNLVCGQRYLQCSVAWPLPDREGDSRMIPVDFQHAPSPVKPPKNAEPAAHATFRELLKQQNLNRLTIMRFALLRARVPIERRVIFVGDGSFTNHVVINGRPPNTIYVGRTRKDLALHYPPAPAVPAPRTGRRRVYGAPAPTPDALRADDTVPWQTFEAFAAGRMHQFKIKTLGPVLWRKTGAGQPLRIVVIAPLGYRLRKGHRMLYRKPAFLLCTDPDLPLAELLQAYLWRWGVEVNFRDEKTLVGTGEAQVRTTGSNQHLPAVTVAAYALLWVAALSLLAEGGKLPTLDPPKWRKDRRAAGQLPSTGDLLRLLRYELWAGALRPGTFFHFATKSPPVASGQKPAPDLAATLFSSN